MIVGFIDRFAINYTLDTSSGGWLYGRFSYVLNNKFVGNYDDVTTLAVAIRGVDHLLERAGQRNDPELLMLPTATAFEKIHSAIFKDDNRNDQQINADAITFGRFNVGGFIDVFDGWYCFLVEGNGIGRFLYAQETSLSSPVEVLLHEGEFDEICRQFLKSIEMLKRPSGL